MCINVAFDGIRKNFTTIKAQDFDLMRLEQIHRSRFDDLALMKTDLVAYCKENILQRGSAMSGKASEFDGEFDKIMDRIGKKVGLTFPK
jgi:hypothetical protein